MAFCRNLRLTLLQLIVQMKSLIKIIYSHRRQPFPGIVTDRHCVATDSNKSRWADLRWQARFERFIAEMSKILPSLVACKILVTIFWRNSLVRFWECAKDICV